MLAHRFNRKRGWNGCAATPSCSGGKATRGLTGVGPGACRSATTPVPDTIADLDPRVSFDLAAAIDNAERAIEHLNTVAGASTLEALGPPPLRSEAVASSRIIGADQGIPGLSTQPRAGAGGSTCREGHRPHRLGKRRGDGGSDRRGRTAGSAPPGRPRSNPRPADGGRAPATPTRGGPDRTELGGRQRRFATGRGVRPATQGTFRASLLPPRSAAPQGRRTKSPSTPSSTWRPPASSARSARVGTTAVRGRRLVRADRSVRGPRRDAARSR